MPNFQGIIFICIQAYKDISKSHLTIFNFNKRITKIDLAVQKRFWNICGGIIPKNIRFKQIYHNYIIFLWRRTSWKFVFIEKSFFQHAAFGTNLQEKFQFALCSQEKERPSVTCESRSLFLSLFIYISLYFF